MTGGSTMTFEQIVAELRDTLKNVDLSKIQGKSVFQINLTGKDGGTFYIQVKDHALSIEPYEYNGRDVAFTLSVKHFFQILRGKMDPVLAFTFGKIKVEGNLRKALELKKLLKNS